MKSKFVLLITLGLVLTISLHAQKRSTRAGSDPCEAKNKKNPLTCKLTTPELRRRKETVIAHLKKQILQRKELKNGFAYKFTADDKTVDELIEFIKTERECCSFFMFNLSVSGDKSIAWLEITGAGDVKSFIRTELEM